MHKLTETILESCNIVRDIMDKHPTNDWGRILVNFILIKEIKYSPANATADV